MLLSGCLDLVWALNSLSGVVCLSHSVGQELPAVDSSRIMVPLVHGCVRVGGRAGQLVGEPVLVGDFGISGASRGLYPGLSSTGDRRHRTRHPVFVLYRLSRSCSGFVLSPRSGQSVPDRCDRSCRWGCLDWGFHLARGRHLCLNLPSQYLMCRDLLVLLVYFVGVPLSWGGVSSSASDS